MDRVFGYLYWYCRHVLFYTETIMIMRLLLILTLVFGIVCRANAKIQTTLSLRSLESLPIQDQGRKKPFLVFADEFLLAMSGTSSLTLDGISATAMEITTSLWLTPQNWKQLPLVLVKNRQLKSSCGLPANQDRFSFETLRDNARLQLQILEGQEARERNPDAKLLDTAKAAEDVASRMIILAALANGSLVRIVPDAAGNSWTALSPVDPRLEKLRTAYSSGNSQAFETSLSALKSSLLESAPLYYKSGVSKIALELFYQKMRPFHWAWILYLFAGFFLFPKDHRAYIVVWSLTLTGLLLQVTGFICRVLIAGRPPVSNMYESIIWVAFGTILFALLFESIYRSRFFLMGAIPVATASLILADSQSVILSPAIHPLTAVLQSNFWLTIHVLTITLSYAAFALAMAIAHIALAKTMRNQTTPNLLYGYIYRVLQVGVLLLACGTILGGVWANYSWGRFWNWDPKETWALITLLIYLIVLHGRIAGKWNGFGLAVGSILGFLSVLMAWYGVNFVLGTGLHSYGFGTGGFRYVICAVSSDLLFLIFAIARNRFYRHTIITYQSAKN
ncbi:MAG: ABC transporter permease [Verrucomicrobia bacterium]|nr:MAG: ABC transporter permease [Verrucomicrobiota bacterium]